MTVERVTRLSVQPGGIAATAASALLRAVAAVAAGFALTAGLSLVLWALTPSGDTDAAEAVSGGTLAFAAAHFLPISLDGSALTLTPLLLTAVMLTVIMTAVGRARPVHGRVLEALHACVFVVAYGVGADALVAVAAPPDTAQPGLGAPLALAALGAALSLARAASGWRSWWAAAVPAWLRQSITAAIATSLAMVSVAALVLSVSLVISVPDALRIAQLTVHSLGDALGMMVVTLAFVPNAVIAAIGYVSGVGFSVGAASYSPLAVHAADLPAVPLLAAVPNGVPGIAAWSTLAAPVVAALVGAWVLRRVGVSRWQRLAACGLTAVLVGAVMAALAAVGAGGITGGPWATMGAAPLLVGALLAGVVLLVTAAATVPIGWRALAWRTTYDDLRGARAETAHTGEVTEAHTNDVAEAPDPDAEAETQPDTVLGTESQPTVEHEEHAEGPVMPDSATGHDRQPDDPLAEEAANAATDAEASNGAAGEAQDDRGTGFAAAG